MESDSRRTDGAAAVITALERGWRWRAVMKKNPLYRWNDFDSRRPSSAYVLLQDQSEAFISHLAKLGLSWIFALCVDHMVDVGVYQRPWSKRGRATAAI